MPRRIRTEISRVREAPWFAFLGELLNLVNDGAAKVVVPSLTAEGAQCITLDATTDPIASSVRDALREEMARLVRTPRSADNLPYSRVLPKWDLARRSPLDVAAVVLAFDRLSGALAHFYAPQRHWQLGRCAHGACAEFFLRQHGHERYCSPVCKAAKAAARVAPNEAASYMREYRSNPRVKLRA